LKNTYKTAGTRSYGIPAVFRSNIVELRGIEPLSESPSTAASPITAYLLTFPPSHAGKQADDFSSFIVLPLRKA